MRSLRTKFLIVVGVFTLLFAGFGFLRTWFSIRRHIEGLTAAQAELALHFDMAIREYVGDKIRPLMEQRVGKSEFIPEAMSTSFVARSVFQEVRRKSPDYVLKFSSDNPRNPLNSAGPEERKIIQYFRDNPAATRWVGPAQINGKDYFVHCIPRRMRADCLHCHGRPEDAPASLTARYGREAGFHRTVGDVIALDTIGIPLDRFQAVMASEAKTQLAMLAIGGAILAAVFVLTFHILIGRRLSEITAHFQRAAEQSAEAALTPVAVRGHDEIGIMATSFNTLAARQQQLHDSLDVRVRERTAELEAEIAERRRIEQALRLAQFCVEHAVDAVFWLDPQGRIVYANQMASRMLQYTSDELRSMTVHDVDPAFPPDLWKTHWEELRRKKSFVLQSAHRTKSGKLLPVEITLSHIDFEGTEINCAFARDITDRKRTEDLLQAAKQAAESANRAKSEFLANMSHEIRTPMTAILGYVDVLADGCTGKCPLARAEVGDPLVVIRHNAQHLLTVIDEILDFSKIDAGRLTVDRTTSSPSSIIAEVASLMRARATGKGLQLDVEYRGPVPESIQTDPTRLRQILINLVGNAVKFTEVGGIRIVAHLEDPTRESPMLQIDVVDTGIGISEESLRRLFSPFTQADTSTIRRFGGTGLGLTISKRLAELLGGDIAVVSAPGKGSTFTLRVPTGPWDGVRSTNDPAEPPVPASSTTNEGRRVLPAGCRLLLAEDGPDNQRLIAHLLRVAGAEVILAENGQLAVERVLAAQQAGTPCDVVLMDIQMPIMDGYEATRQLRRAGYTRPVIALTAHALIEDRQKCLDAGCDDYLSKPVNRSTLLDVVASWVRCVQADRPPPSAAACVAPDQGL
jgi:PAS domain S-box-containing protein